MPPVFPPGSPSSIVGTLPNSQYTQRNVKGNYSGPVIVFPVSVQGSKTGKQDLVAEPVLILLHCPRQSSGPSCMLCSHHHPLPFMCR